MIELFYSALSSSISIFILLIVGIIGIAVLTEKERDIVYSLPKEQSVEAMKDVFNAHKEGKEPDLSKYEEMLKNSPKYVKPPIPPEEETKKYGMFERFYRGLTGKGFGKYSGPGAIEAEIKDELNLIEENSGKEYGKTIKDAIIDAANGVEIDPSGRDYARKKLGCAAVVKEHMTGEGSPVKEHLDNVTQKLDSLLVKLKTGDNGYLVRADNPNTGDDIKEKKEPPFYKRFFNKSKDTEGTGSSDNDGDDIKEEKEPFYKRFFNKSKDTEGTGSSDNDGDDIKEKKVPLYKRIFKWPKTKGTDTPDITTDSIE